MSHVGLQDAGDIEITCSFRDLRVTIVGPATQATDLLRIISTSTPSPGLARPPSPAATDGSFDLVQAEVSSFVVPETRDQILASFDPCPSSVIASGRRLVGATTSPEGRVRRAWVAGKWAGAVEIGPTLPEEENVTPRRRKPGNPRTTSDAKPKKVTTADLAASMEGLLQAIPTLTSQVDQLHRRQVEFEASLSTMPLTGRPTLSKPLGGAPTSTSGLLGTMAKTIPAPPRTQGRQAPGLLASPLVKKPLELAELEKEKMAPRTEDSSLAQAVLAQSQALTTLVTQIAQASGDPMSDLAGSSATPGSRGALGRAKLQAELAAQRGTFFNSVLAQMSRRMNPTSAQELGPKELLEKGINGVRYLERFGGYGRQRDIGCLQYQVMQIFDCLMDENILAARDLVALLAITLEQMNMDGGRMDLASVVCLHEDPPSSIFQMRHLSSTSRSRAFAPLADQKLITVALAYLKELDVIQSKRFELVGTGKGKTALGDDPAPKVKAKGAPKRKQRWKEKEEGEEET